MKSIKNNEFESKIKSRSISLVITSDLKVNIFEKTVDF